MALSLVQSERRNAAAEAVSDMKRATRGNTWRQMFINRSHDAEFAQIGRAALGDRRSNHFESDKETAHLVVWAGYEVATRNTTHAPLSIFG